MIFYKKDYSVVQADNKSALELIVDKHYLHRKCPVTQAFFLLNSIKQIVGVVSYGTPSSAPLRSGICGSNQSLNVYELNRLWVDDSVPKNGESFLISQTLPLCLKQIIVSYADTAQNHIGYVYQATNWIYTGLSAKRTNWTIAGLDKHCQTIADKYSSQQLKELYGDKFTLVPRSRKHRYVYFNANKRIKKQLIEQLKYPILPYPKSERI